MDFGIDKLLSKGQEITCLVGGQPFKGTIKEVSRFNFEPEYLVRFEDGTSVWLNNVKIRHFIGGAN